MTDHGIFGYYPFGLFIQTSEFGLSKNLIAEESRSRQAPQFNFVLLFDSFVKGSTQANCDVIVDDVGYSDEPVFSDGYLAQAVNLAVSSTDAPGKKVVYCSAAGNAGDNGYRHPFEAIPDSKVRATGGHGNLKLGEVNESLTGGGWHNWNPNPGPVEPSTDVTNLTDPTGQYQLYLQWDDAFDLDHGITTDLNGAKIRRI